MVRFNDPLSTLRGSILTSENMKTKIKKYRKFILPKEIVEAIVYTAQQVPFEGECLLPVCFSVVNDIIKKSPEYNRSDDNRFYIPMYSSGYLKVKYGNNYASYMRWMVIYNILYSTEAYKDNCTYYFLQNPDTYSSLCTTMYSKDSVDVYTYCLEENIEISPVPAVFKGMKEINKNRIYNDWYEVKIPINRGNKRYLTRQYEDDSKFINNAPHHIKKMGQAYRKISIRYDEAKAFIENQYINELYSSSKPEEISAAYYRYASRLNSINEISNGKKNKSLRFSRNATNNRLDTNLTNMASDLRKFIVGIEDMVYIDLKNSQPVLFNLMLNDYREGASPQLLEEIEKYKQLTATGKWYEYLGGLFQADREFGKQIWMKIAYSKNSSNKDAKKIIKNDFPLMMEIIESIKQENHADFAIGLQKLESNIFIDEICRALVKASIIPYSLHDGLLLPVEHESKAIEIIMSILKAHLGINPELSIEYFSEKQKLV